MNRFASLTTLELQAGLLADSREPLRRSLLRPLAQRKGHQREILQSGNAPVSQLIHLDLGNARDKGQMIICSAYIVTVRPPSACMTELDGFRIGWKCFERLYGVFEARFDQTIVGQIVAEPECLRLEVAAW